MAPKAPVAPAIFHTDEQGVTWSYQPDTKAWSASDGTHRTRSQSFDTVRSKRQEWGAERPAAPQRSVEPLESHVAVLKGNPFDAAMNGEIPSANGHSLKSEWHAAKGAPQIMRFKETRDGSGWSTTGASSLMLVSADAAAEHAEVWRRLVGVALDVAAVAAAEAALAQAWVDSKTDTTRFIEQKGMRGAREWSDRDRPRDRFGMSRDLVVSSSLWPTVLPRDGQPASLQGWEQADDGSYHREGVRLSLRVKGTWGNPDFVVERAVEGGVQEVLASGEWPVALSLANATVACQVDQWSAVEAWKSSDRWFKEKRSPLHWPERFHIMGAAVVMGRDAHRADDSASMYLLQLPLAHPVEGIHKNHSSQRTPVPTHPVWTSSSAYGDAVLVEGGPEDVPVMAALEALRALRHKVASRLDRDAIAASVKDQAEHVLRRLHEDQANGEEPVANPQTALNAWTRWFDRLQARVQAEPERAALAEHIAEAVALSTPPAPSRSAPRP